MTVEDDFRIVIINDDPGDEALLRRCLQKGFERPYTIVVARTGEEGIRACRALSAPGPHCVLIIDLHLPDMSGLEVIERLKDDAGDIRHPAVLFIDSGEECKAAAAALRAGAQDYIGKTWLTPDGLACALDNAILRFKLMAEHREQQAALERREGEFKALVENAPDIITRFDTKFRHVYINPAIERFTGLPPEHFLDKTSREAGLDPEFGTDWETKLREVIECRREITFELDFKTATGKKAFHTRLVPECSATGKLRSILSISTDFTERKRAEESLRASEEHLRDVLDSLFAFVGVMTPDGILVEANRTSLRAASLQPEEVLGRPFEDLYWWSYSPEVQADLRRAIERAAGGESTRYDVRVRVGEDRFLVIDFMLAPLVDVSGKVTHLIPSAIDITARVQAEEALLESEKRFRRFATSDIIGIFFGDIHGGLSYVNDEYLRIIGYSREEFEASRLRWTDITPPEWLEADQRAIAEARITGSCTPYEKEYVRRDGKRVPILSGFTLLIESRDETVAFIMDITDRKRSETALKEADKRKDEFLAMLAHELRNPLAAIRTAIHLLKLKGPPEPDLVWGREVIERQVKQLTRLIDDLLDVSRITTGKIQLRREPIDVAEVVAQAAEAVRPLMDAKGHALSIQLPSDPLPAMADPARLEQVVGNLLANAAKYTDNGGAITLSGTLEEPWIVIRVQDNGIGIASEMLPNLFGLFTQVDSTVDRAQGGLGIGLTLVKMLVEMHGGTVSVTSDGPGQGSEFTIRIPTLVQVPRLIADASQPQGNAEGFKPLAPLRPSRVLVVDDNEDMALGIAKSLEAAGYEVKTAADGPSALEIARGFRPEFVLLDIGMPGMSGYDLAAAFREDKALREAALIAISGYGQHEDRKRSRDAGFAHHLLKPLELDTLLALLARPV
jgi:PAS domain S-box-containing protein